MKENRIALADEVFTEDTHIASERAWLYYSRSGGVLWRVGCDERVRSFR